MEVLSLAQFVAGSYSIVHVLVLIIVAGAAVAITYAILGRMGVTIDPIFVRVFWIIAIAVLGIVALRFILSLA
jgi:hypothetical protein